MSFHIHNFLTSGVVTNVPKHSRGTFSTRMVSYKTPYFLKSVKVPISFKIFGRTVEDFNEAYCYTKVAAIHLKLGDYLYLPFYNDPVTVKTHFNISTLLLESTTDTCRIPDIRLNNLISRLVKNKEVTEVDTNYVLTCLNIESVDDLTDYLRLMYSVTLGKRSLDINHEFLLLVSMYIRGSYTLLKNHLVLQGTKEELNTIYDYFNSLGYNRYNTKTVVLTSENLTITSNLFLDLFTNGFFDLNFLKNLSKKNGVILITHLVDTKFTNLKSKLQTLNIQNFIYMHGELIGVAYNKYSESYDISFNIKDYYIKTISGFLIEITDISISKNEIKIDFIE